MADEPSEVTRVDWKEVFSFTRVFKSFRLALNLSNMTLALAAVFLICLTGWVMDELWGLTGQSVMVGRAGEDEIALYSRATGDQFAQQLSAWKQGRPQRTQALFIGAVNEQRSLSALISLLPRTGAEGRYFREALGDAVTTRNAEEDGDKQYQPPDPKKIREDAKADWRGVLDRARHQHRRYVDEATGLIEKSFGKAEEGIDKDSNLSDQERKQATAQLAADRLAALRALTRVRMAFNQSVDAICGVKIADSLIAYESACLKDGVVALLTGNIAGGLAEYRAPEPPRGAAATQPGFLLHMLKARDGLCWLVSRHYLYAAVFCLIVLGIWSVCGGAIHRIAAVQAAREEKISLVQALRFSRGKFLSFFSAPLFPLALIGALGLVLFVGGLLGNIPLVGPFLVGLLFFLALLLGLVIAFLGVGLLAGGALMFPTIAVEGSDSFDAISRSFAYVWSRPWRAALYGAVALVHGSICYLFVRFFAFLALSATHLFVRWGVMTTAESLPNVPSPDTMDGMWARPTFANLHEWNWEAMSATEAIGAVFLAVWVYVVIGGVVAFVLSYLAGSTTTIYYLLRREVDATDLDEVYVDDDEEEPPFDDTLGEAEETADEAAETPAEPQDDQPAEEEASSDDQAPDQEAGEEENKKS